MLLNKPKRKINRKIENFKVCTYASTVCYHDTAKPYQNRSILTNYDTL